MVEWIILGLIWVLVMGGWCMDAMGWTADGFWLILSDFDGGIQGLVVWT